MGKDPPNIKKSLEDEGVKNNKGGGKDDPIMGKDPSYPQEVPC